MSKKSKRKNQYSCQISAGDYTFIFQEADIQAYEYAVKDGMNPTLIIFVYITDKDGAVAASYERIWEKPVNSANVCAFMGKFAQDSKYRQKFQTSGDPILVAIPKTDEIVKPQCAAAIRRINAANPCMLKFRDFAALKTYGRDKVSSMKMGVLKDIVSEEEFKQITEAVEEDDVVSVLRWVKRGLLLGHAIHKVNVDREISNNASR